MHFQGELLIAGMTPAVAVEAADQHLTVAVDLSGKPQVGQTLLLITDCFEMSLTQASQSEALSFVPTVSECKQLATRLSLEPTSKP